MTKEETMLEKRLIELSKTAYHRDIVTFSDFLNLNELHILHSIPKNLLSSQYETFGGYEYAERQIAAFLPGALYYAVTYPIQVLRISPIHAKYAEELTHRDYLGAILNLGIDRSRVGDLAIQDGSCLVFCGDKIADFMAEQLTRVRHTVVMAEKLKLEDFSYKPGLQELSGTAASIRLDSILAIGFPMSRSKLTGYIEGGKVYVNGRLITSNGYHLKENDIISVRGMGRIIYGGILSETRKGRYFVRIYKY